MRDFISEAEWARCGHWGHVRKSVASWIQEGSVAEKERFPWLRERQLAGEDLFIIGASREACLACAHAWSNGFRPVLVVMRDLLGESEQEVREMAAEIVAYQRNAGLAMYGSIGPQVLFSESSDCKVFLDAKGALHDAFFCLSNDPLQQGDKSSDGELWCCTKGPALVVDDFAQASNALMLEDASDLPRRTLLRFSVAAERRSLCSAKQDKSTEEAEERLEERLTEHSANVAAFRETLASPLFWEQRYDPECLPCRVVSYAHMFKVAPLAVVSIVMQTLVFSWAAEPLFPVLRIMSKLLHEVPMWYSSSYLTLGRLGVEFSGNRFSFFLLAMGMVQWLGCILPQAFVWGDERSTLSDFVVSIGVSSLVTMPAMEIHLRCKLKVKPTKEQSSWVNCYTGFATGGWVVSVPIMFSYLFVLDHAPFLASVFLSLAFTLVEFAFVRAASRQYMTTVPPARRKDPCAYAGNQKEMPQIVIGVVHACIETGKLMSMVIAAYKANSLTYLSSALTSVLTNLLLNCLSRTGWAAHLASVLGSQLWPGLDALVCPVGASVYHANAKFVMGWPRFLAVLPLMLGRGLKSGNWSTPMTSQDPSVWCFNGVVLLTVGLAFAFEVLEDVLVFVLNRSRPAPHWQRFHEVMRSRAEQEGGAMHLRHVMLPLESEKGNPEDGGASYRITPNMKQMVFFDFNIWFATVLFPYTLAAALMNISLGPGVTFGYCGVPIEGFLNHVLAAFVYKLDPKECK